MKFFKGYKNFMFGNPEEEVPEYLKKEIGNLWYLPENIKIRSLLNKVISTNFKGNWFIGEVIDVTSNRGYVQIKFPKGFEYDTHWVKLDEIHSIKA